MPTDNMSAYHSAQYKGRDRYFELCRAQSEQIHSALESGEKDKIEALLKNTHVTDFDKQRGLYHAARYGQTEIVALLLAHKTDPNAIANVDGIKPISIAIRHNYLEIVKLLVQHGADFIQRNPFPLFREEDGLSGQYPDLSPLGLAPYLKKTEIMQFLDKALKEVNQVNTEIQSGKKEKIEALLNGQRSTYLCRDFSKEDALYYAVMHGKTETVQLLLAHNVDVNLSSNAGKTKPIYTAIWYNHPDIVQLLVQYGADFINKNLVWLPNTKPGLKTLLSASDLATQLERDEILDFDSANSAKIKNRMSISHITTSPLEQLFRR